MDNHALEIRYTLRAFTQALSVLAAARGLTAAEFRLMRTLSENSNATQAELADLAAMDRPYVSALVRRMAERGLLLSRVNIQDRRRTKIAFSAEGARVYEELARELEAVNREAAAGISPAELRAFRSVLARMQANLANYA